MKYKLALGAFLLSASLAVPLHAEKGQSEAGKKLSERAEKIASEIKQACQMDVQTYCNDVTPGGGRLAFCMMAHEDRISDQCADTLFSVAEGIRLTMSNIVRAADACEADVSKLCGNVQAGQGQIMQCVRQHQAELSTNCRAELASLKERAQPMGAGAQQQTGPGAGLGAGMQSQPHQQQQPPQPQPTAAELATARPARHACWQPAPRAACPPLTRFILVPRRSASPPRHPCRS